MLLDLNEKVVGRHVLAYHRTKDEKILKNIFQSGFRSGEGALHGRGIYLTYDLESQMNQRMRKLYGPVIIKSKINITNYLIFDKDIARPIYQENFEIPDQLKNIFSFSDKEIKPIVRYYRGRDKARRRIFNSAFAVEVLNILGQANLIKHGVQGLILTGKLDGRVIIAYNDETVFPLEYAYSGLTNFLLGKKVGRWYPLPSKISPVAYLNYLDQQKERFLPTLLKLTSDLKAHPTYLINSRFIVPYFSLQGLSGNLISCQGILEASEDQIKLGKEFVRHVEKILLSLLKRHIPSLQREGRITVSLPTPRNISKNFYRNITSRVLHKLNLPTERELHFSFQFYTKSSFLPFFVKVFPEKQEIQLDNEITGKQYQKSF